MEAVNAFQEALKERTREQSPFYWGKTQDHLGAALRALGEREASVEDLQKAVESFTRAKAIDPSAADGLKSAEVALARLRASTAASRGRSPQ